MRRSWSLRPRPIRSDPRSRRRVPTWRRAEGTRQPPLLLRFVRFDAWRRHRARFAQPLGRPELGEALLVLLRPRRIDLIGGLEGCCWDKPEDGCFGVGACCAMAVTGGRAAPMTANAKLSAGIIRIQVLPPQEA